MIEENLLNYGILGLWTTSLIIEKFKFQKEMKQVVEDNTKILIILKDRLK